MAKLVTENLSKIFGPRPERVLEFLENGGTKAEAQKRFNAAVGVHDVSLEINEGETFVLMGLSGSGKSTLLRLLNRLHEPTAGRILVDGEPITGLSPKDLRQVRSEKFAGMVFQHFAILPHRTVMDNVAYGLEVQGVSRQDRYARAQEAITQVGLAGWEQSYPHQLSGGMQQRVGLARSLTVDGNILLMDEAFSALDPLIRKEMQEELLDLQARLKKTIVFVTHDLDEALKLGDRIAIMRDARVVQLGTAEEIVSNPADEYVRAFVEGADRTGVLTAESIMQRPKTTAILRDGPQTALNKIRRHGLSSLFVVSTERKLHGLVVPEQLLEHRNAGTIPMEIVEDVTAVHLDTPLDEIIDLAATLTGPIAVTDEANRLRGVIVKGAILAALSNNGNGLEEADV